MSVALPPDPTAALHQERALRAERRWAEAEALLAAAVRSWPDDEALLVDHGLIAHEQMHWPEMAARFAVLRQRFPGHPFGYSRTGEALRWLQRFDEADAVIGAGVPLFPDSMELFVQWVLVGCEQAERGVADWRAAEQRGEEFIARLPDDPQSYRYAAEPYQRRQRWADADATIAEGLHRLGLNPALVTRFAELATLRGDWAAAARRWANVVRHLPDDEAAHLGRIQALRQLGRTDDLESATAAAALHFPESLPLAREHAWAANLRRDWTAAAARWRGIVARQPNDPGLRERLAEAELQAGRLPTPAPAPAATPGSEPTDLSQLLLRFESLGEDCEFGLIQRHLGLEPLALFRFAGITLDNLIAALNADLAGIGTPEFTRVHLRDGVEYMIDDTRFGLGMHTFTGPEQISAEQFAAGAQRRLQFLARKLLDDLRQPTKLFVRTSRAEEPLERVIRLAGTLRRLGPATLLFVQQSPDPQRIGRAEWYAPGIMRGWIERFSITDPLDTQWHMLCRAAHALWMAGPPAGYGTAPSMPQEAEPQPAFAVVQPIALTPATAFGFPRT